MSSSSVITSSPVVVLSLLEAYIDTHDQAREEQKAGIWELTKARRIKTRGMVGAETIYAASSIREELVARTMLRVNGSGSGSGAEESLSLGDPPDLVEDDTTQTTTSFSLFDCVDEKASSLSKHAEKKNIKSTGAENAMSSTTTGLRNRKQATETAAADAAAGSSSSKSKTTAANDEWIMDTEMERTRLQSVDPLELFGALPPRELIKAQEKAKQALESYIEAANIVAALQRQMMRPQKL